MNEVQGIGIGPTAELRLRVSVASLARVVIPSPDSDGQMLVLERKATFHHDQNQPHATVMAQPFGGAVRLLDAQRLHLVIDDFHFDSQRSRDESDLRIYIRPSDWNAVRDFCVNQFQSSEEDALESSPSRELIEEFTDALGVVVSPESFQSSPLWTVVENHPAITGNIHAADQPTVRIYRVFDVQLTNGTLAAAVIENSRAHSDDDLTGLITLDAQQGGRGRANAALVLPLDDLLDHYRGLPVEQRNLVAIFDGHFLEPNVTALFEKFMAERYRRV